MSAARPSAEAPWGEWPAASSLAAAHSGRSRKMLDVDQRLPRKVIFIRAATKEMTHEWSCRDRVPEWSEGRRGSPKTAGTAALFVLVRKATADKVLEGLRGEGGTVLKISLDHTKEAALQAALAGVQAAVPSPPPAA
jgi:uncharacterized protein DUF1269